MKSLLLIACLAVFGAGCQGLAAPTATPGPVTAGPATPGPGTTPVAPPPAPATPRQWSIYTSRNMRFSLQLPSDWTVEPGIPAEDILLQVFAGDEGTMLMLEDFPNEAESFRSYARRYFKAILEGDPDAVEFVEYEAGHAARSSRRTGDSLTAYYLFVPEGGSAKVLTFSWGQPTPNPVWEMVAERFNPNSTELIIPFGTPAPASPAG